MKISKVLFHIYALGKGGAERVVLTLAAEMAAKGIDCVVATLTAEKEEYPLPEGVRRVICGLSEAEEKKGKLSRMRLRIGHLRKCMAEEKPDLVISFMKSANYRAILAARPLKIPIMISVRNDPEKDYASKRDKMIAKKLYASAAGAVFQTKSAAAFFKDCCGGRSRVILNPVNPAFLKEPYTGERRKSIVSVGRFSYQKDQLTLVKAFERLLKDYPDYTLELIGGDTKDNSRLQVAEYVHAHGLEERVLMKGGRKDVEEYIRDAAMFVLPSVYEGMPNALIEAMVLGLPVIATDCPCGGPAALIEDGGNGLLVECSNAKEMAAAMRKMLEYPEEAARVAKAASELREKVSAGKITAEWLEFAEERTDAFGKA
ncbi:MAG: glycosyltransferase [Lachnospiraceae bacterium]|nr:glycosyltransferase [Lachnospiraceae bacterium]